VIAMTDTLVGKTLKTTYRGELQLSGAASSGMRVTQSAARAVGGHTC
jgi:hypothetical protein